MKLKLLFVSAIAVSVMWMLPLTACAQQDAPVKHPIETALQQCLAKSHATMPRARCYSQASDAWDKDVAVTYAELLRRENAVAKSSLQAAQAAWEKYRDAEFDYLAELYWQRKGTGYIAVRIVQRSEIVRARALQLENRLVAVKASTGTN